MKIAKQVFKWMLQAGAVTLIAGILGLLLLMAAFSLPVDRIREHVGASLELLEEEGHYPSYFFKDACATLDNYTETLYLNQAIVGTDNDSLLTCALSGYRFESTTRDLLPIWQLEEAINGDGDTKLVSPDKRFFNGYETVIKPLLCVTDYSGIRQINLYTVLFLTLLLVGLMFRRGLGACILPVTVSVLFIHPLAVALCMTFVGFYYCMVIPCICFLLLSERTLREKAWLLFALTGAVTFYFNMNYFQLLCFAMPFMFYVLILGLPEKPGELIRMILAAFLPWCVGYAGMMVFKWILYALAVDSGVFREMLDFVKIGTGSNRGSRPAAVLKNITTALSNRKWLVMEALFVVYSVIRRLRGRAGSRVTASAILLLAFMTLTPLCRCLLLSNHVTVHHWVTYRILMMPVLAFNLLITGVRNEKKPVDI